MAVPCIVCVITMIRRLRVDQLDDEHDTTLELGYQRYPRMREFHCGSWTRMSSMAIFIHPL